MFEMGTETKSRKEELREYIKKDFRELCKIPENYRIEVFFRKFALVGISWEAKPDTYLRLFVHDKNNQAFFIYEQYKEELSKLINSEVAKHGNW